MRSQCPRFIQEFLLSCGVDCYHLSYEILTEREMIMRERQKERWYGERERDRKRDGNATETERDMVTRERQKERW